MTQPPQAAIFDMDGTLLDSERIYLATFRETRRAMGLPPDDGLFMDLVGLGHALAGQVLTRAMGAAATEFDQLWSRRLTAAFQAPVPLKPDADRLLAHLAQAGTPIAVATSTQTDAAVQRLDRAGLGPYIACVIGGDQVERGKPAPDIYHRAAAQLGQPTAACAAFEDSEAGTRAAVAAGCRTVQIPDLKPPSAQLRALGHRIAPTLWEGAVQVGLI